MKTDVEIFVERVHVLRTETPDLTLAAAVLRVRLSEPALSIRVLETVGSWPSSEPEIRALQGLS